MENRFYLMRKNEVITLVQFDDAGKMTAFSKNISENAKDLAPLAYRATSEIWLKEWWDNRSIPLTRDQIKTFLQSQGFNTPDQYLIKNLGLSLTDYYWIKPVDSNLTWEKVNLYDNSFHTDVLLSEKKPKSDNIIQYSPNSSLQGNLEKAWTISDSKRCLIKGNKSGTSAESLNEIIATEIHKLQSYDNYTSYDLIHIKNKPYIYGCISEAFTSQYLELQSAWDVITSEPRDNSTSYYEHFINICKKHGIDEDQLRHDLEYQIQADFILTNYDRHLTNIAILRDADTLGFIRMAPIYDSGDSLFANRSVPDNIKELEKMEITGFANRETKLLNLVQNRLILDINKLPSPEYVSDIYHKDEKISDKHIDKLVEWYKRKIDIFDAWQHGDIPYDAMRKTQ